MHELALPITIANLIDEYDVKNAAIEDAIKDFNDAHQRLGMAATVYGTYAEQITPSPHLYAASLRKNLLKSGWKAIYNRLQMDELATAKDKQLFERTMADPPELTLETAKATFGDYLVRPRFHMLRGLAEVFTQLDPAYKSHSKVRVGVKGLPKRIILNGWGEYSYGTARDRFRDMVNALAALRGQARYSHDEGTAIDLAHRAGLDAICDGRGYIEKARYQHETDKAFATVDRGITVRRFANGNAHVFFDKWALLDINRALGEFYGEVLPDVEPDDADHRPGTAVSKDLQFYWSPPEVVAAALDFANIHTRDQMGERGWANRQAPRVLEPSCGTGHILDELRARGCKALGMEYHLGRATQARGKGHAVQHANFLEQPATGDFDAVVMNPPFFGRHYAKHVRHALGFLKPGGVLVAILPASARYDHDELDGLGGEWRDLPVASFADAGTNVPTIMFRSRRPV